MLYIRIRYRVLFANGSLHNTNLENCHAAYFRRPEHGAGCVLMLPKVKLFEYMSTQYY
jgi:hypothetical protein